MSAIANACLDYCFFCRSSVKKYFCFLTRSLNQDILDSGRGNCNILHSCIYTFIYFFLIILLLLLFKYERFLDEMQLHVTPRSISPSGVVTILQGRLSTIVRGDDHTSPTQQPSSTQWTRNCKLQSYTVRSGKTWSCPCAQLIKHYAMKTYGGVEV
jgi:hypothetical protein